MSESTMDKITEAQSGAAYEIDAAVIVDNELGPIIASGPVLGMSTTMTAKFCSFKCSVIPSNHIHIYVGIPREGCSYTFKEAPKSVFDRFPNAKGREKGLTIIRVSLTEEARVTVNGFGMPFANADDAEVEGWVNENKPIIYNLSFVLRQRTLYLVIRLAVDIARKRFPVDKLPPSSIHTARAKKGTLTSSKT
ncbi:hypothetical protein TrVFT333_009839 [Trichoderma virens FT-333]|nr:hypothetical protein TrVFT333_009839 [Trichoderma virens FT-333]